MHKEEDPIEGQHKATQKPRDPQRLREVVPIEHAVSNRIANGIANTNSIRFHLGGTINTAFDNCELAALN